MWVPQLLPIILRRDSSLSSWLAKNGSQQHLIFETRATTTRRIYAGGERKTLGDFIDDTIQTWLLPLPYQYLPFRAFDSYSSRIWIGKSITISSRVSFSSTLRILSSSRLLKSNGRHADGGIEAQWSDPKTNMDLLRPASFPILCMPPDFAIRLCQMIIPESRNSQCNDHHNAAAWERRIRKRLAISQLSQIWSCTQFCDGQQLCIYRQNVRPFCECTVQTAQNPFTPEFVEQGCIGLKRRDLNSITALKTEREPENYFHIQDQPHS